jgi:hypothetical protein
MSTGNGTIIVANVRPKTIRLPGHSSRVKLKATSALEATVPIAASTATMTVLTVYRKKGMYRTVSA